jgi:3-oxoacyl-[acyl-carrier-protein] synthase II
VRIAHSRIEAGQSDIVLVGGAFNSERPDLLMLYDFGGYILKGTYAPVWERQSPGGTALGSLGAFVVFESRAHAEARSAKKLARLSQIYSHRSRRRPGDVEAALAQMWSKLGGSVDGRHAAFLSGATGAEPATAEERAFLASHKDIAVRATGTYLGHGMEPQFPMNVALATLAISHGRLFPSADRSGMELAMEGPLRQAIVTSVGHWRGEGLALIEAP